MIVRNVVFGTTFAVVPVVPGSGIRLMVAIPLLGWVDFRARSLVCDTLNYVLDRSSRHTVS
jgi:hypothetical protein